MLKAMAWAIGFGFQKVQARPKPTPGQHFWLGMAWPVWPGLAWLLAWPGLAFGLARLGFWPEVKSCTSLAAGHFSELSNPGADFVFPFEAKAWVYTFNQLSTTVSSILSFNFLRFLTTFRHLTLSPSQRQLLGTDSVTARPQSSTKANSKTVRKDYLQIKQRL